MSNACSRVCVCLLAALPACTITNDLDVCDRSPGSSNEVNTERLEGGQRTGGPRSVVAMPFGGALSAFASDASGDPADDRDEIRIAVLAPDGSPQLTGNQPNEKELVVAPATKATAFERRGQPFVVAPATDDSNSPGAVVYSVLGEQSSQVFATFIAGGTAGPFGDEVEPLQISDEAGPACELVRSKNAVESRCVTEAGAVLLGTAPDGRSDFAVTWIASHFTDTAVTTSVRGRLLRVGWNTHEFLTSQDTVDTQPVDLVTGANVRSATLVSIGKGKLALLWQELGRGLTTRWQVLDSRLRAASRPDLDVSSKSPPTDPRLAAAFDGKQLAVVWVEQAAEGRTRIVLRRVHTDGSDADDGSPVPIASSAGVQSAPAITVLADGRGFFVVWEETGGQGDESDLRAAALTADGAIRFVNPACDRAAFVLGNDSGPQHDPATTTLKNGSVLTVWTDGSSRGADHSRTAVWSAVLSPRELLPIE